MRTRLIALSLAAAAAAACSQDDQPTSPAVARPDAAARVNASVSPTTDGIRVPQAKPSDQVGFTKVILVWGTPINVAAGDDAGGSAQCPAGSVPTGGGFETLGTQPFQPPAITWMSRPDPLVNPTGWVVAITNKVAGAATSTVTPYVLCAS